MHVDILDCLSVRNNSVSKCVFQIHLVTFALFLLLLREKHQVFLLICLFLLITKVFIKFKRILFGKNIRLCAFKRGIYHNWKRTSRRITVIITMVDICTFTIYELSHSSALLSYSISLIGMRNKGDQTFL